MASISGSSGPYSASAYGTVNFHEWTIPANGEYSIVLDTTGLQSTGAQDLLVILRNGQNVDGATDPPRRTYTGSFVAGDVLIFQVFVMAARSNMRASWTITSAALDPSVPVDPVPGGTGLGGVVEVGGIDMIYFGGDEADALYKGTLLVWEALKGPQADATIWLDFSNPNIFLQNKGTSSATLPVMTSSGAITRDKDHAIFGTNGRVFAEPNSTWAEGFTLSMWTRDTPANSGWRTIMHRAMPTGTLTNEAYIVHNTGMATGTVAGLKFGSTHREFTANYSLPVGTDWFHTVVSWERTSSTTFQCRFFINGIPRGSFNGTGYPSNSQFSTEELYIGGNRTAGEWSGRMDDLIMWRRALTDAEVVELYNQGRSSVPQITTTTINEMKRTIPFSQQFTADFPVTSWSATGVPAGLTFNTSTGLLSGTPTTISSGTMTVTANGTGISDQSALSWSVISALVSISVPFNSNGDIDYYFPTRGFDARTSSSSPRNAAFTFNGMLVAGDNNVATYWQGLHDTQINSEQVEWILTTGDVMNTIARPTEIILSSDVNFQNQLVLQIGSGNLYLASRTTGSTSNLSPLSRTIGTNSTIRVLRTGLNIQVWHNTTRVINYTGTTSNAAAWFRTAGRGYTGITMYSTSGQWSSRVADWAVQQLV